MENLKLEVIGNPSSGRPTMGPTTSVITYRIVRLIALDLLEGDKKDQGEKAVYEAGKIIGKATYEQWVKSADSLEIFVEKITRIFNELKLGVLTVKEVNKKKGELFFRVNVDECASCSGTPKVGRAICQLEGGVLAGLFGAYANTPVEVKEVKCWGLGDKTCEFEIRAAE